MDVLLWVIFGAIAAWISGIFIGTHSWQRLVWSVALGVGSAVLAGAVMRLIAGHNEGGVNYYSLLLATAASLLIVALTTRKEI